MTNKDFKEKYFAEKGIRWYDNWVDYANWLEDALIEALLQPPVSNNEVFEHYGKPFTSGRDLWDFLTAHYNFTPKITT